MYFQSLLKYRYLVRIYLDTRAKYLFCFSSLGMHQYGPIEHPDGLVINACFFIFDCELFSDILHEWEDSPFLHSYFSLLQKSILTEAYFNVDLYKVNSKAENHHALADGFSVRTRTYNDKTTSDCLPILLYIM